MKAIGLKFFTDTHLTGYGLVIFFVVFAAVLILQFTSQHKEQVKVLERLPFEGEDHEFRQS